MKTIDFTTTSVLIALKLIAFSYGGESDDESTSKTLLDESHTRYIDRKTYTTEEWRSSDDPIEHRLFLKDEEDTYVSTWNDIPLLTGRDRVFRVVTVVPRRTTPIMAISTQQELNPIIQFFHENKARYLPKSFSQTYGYSWNLGSFPQTWQDIHKLDELTKFAGDNGLVDVLEIGDLPAKRGQVKEVKVLAAYPMIDRNEWNTAWKVIAIDADHPKAGALNDVDDVRGHYPGLLGEVEKWLTTYRQQIGLSKYWLPSLPAQFIPLNAAGAEEVVLRKHENWKELQRRTTMLPYCSRLSRTNTMLGNPLSEKKEVVDRYIPMYNIKCNGPGSILTDDENV